MELIKTPQEILMEQAGLPHYADGKAVRSPSPEDMQAHLIAQGYTPPRFADGKSVGPQQKSIIFNIGKDVNGVKNVLTHDQILGTMKKLGFEPEHAHVVFAQPNTEFGPHEDTLVVKAKGNPQDLHMKTHILAEHLSQDAIPAKLEGAASGILAGPKAADWGGQFSPQYFVEHGSTTAAGNNPSGLKETLSNVKAALTPSLQTQEKFANIAGKASKLADIGGKAWMGLSTLGEGMNAYNHLQQGETGKAAEDLVGAGAAFLPMTYGLPIQGAIALKNMPPPSQENVQSALDLTNKVAPNQDYLKNTD